MPRFPHFSNRVDVVTGSVFEKFLPKMREQGDKLIKLHIGDCYLPPTYDLPIADAFVDANPHLNRYCNTHGIAPLRNALAEKLRADNALDVSEENVMITSGASNALNVAVFSLINPNEEVLILTPCWPFFRGMVKIAGGVPVEIPLYTKLYENPDLDITATLAEHLSPKTSALYLNSPNNPSGKVLNRQQLAAIADFAKEHSLWLISDEAYDGMVFDDHQHISPASFPGMQTQTISIFTFSKVYMFAGIRLGYAVAENSVLAKMNRILVHQLYGANTPGQLMMVEPVKTRQSWGGEFVSHCADLRDRFSQALQFRHQLPDGAYYVFFDTTGLVEDGKYWEAIDQCLDSGVSVAPGNDFGRDFESYVRVCFAGESPDRIQIAAERLNQVFMGAS